VRLAPEAATKGTVLLPPGTKAISIDTRFVLPDGRLSVSYPPLSTAGAVEVEHVRITQPGNKNLEGWVVRGYLECDYSPLP
jgi:hypothetical protein